MPTHLTLPVNRATRPDNAAMVAAIRAALGDQTATLSCPDGQTVYAKKATDWTPAHIAQAQTVIAQAAALTPQLAAQRQVDQFPIEYRALVLALVDAINVLRTHPAIGLPAVTPAQALAAIRTKAGTL
jgi:hypothetical protein